MALIKAEKLILRRAIRDKGITDDVTLDQIGQSDSMAKQLIAEWVAKREVNTFRDMRKAQYLEQLAQIEEEEAEDLEIAELINQLPTQG
jgi:hypothetical protein